MMDITRLMFDDGASRPAEQEEPETCFLFDYQGKLWVAKVAKGPIELDDLLEGPPAARGWFIFEAELAAFKENPSWYANECWSASAGPGWTWSLDEGTPWRSVYEDEYILRFEEA